MDLEYKIGIVETKVDLQSEEIIGLRKDVTDLKDQVRGWQNRATGAITVLSGIGSIVLFLGHDLFVLIKTKLGL